MSFRTILERLLAAPGAVAAAFLDPEGQPVEQVGDVEAIEVLAAYQSVWLTAMNRGAERMGISPLNEITLDLTKKRLVCSEVKDGYFLLVVLEPDGVPSMARSRLEDARLSLAAEIF
jgi:predicted regulator of Ras-like GTPase activity (Roadblock/LC7/MglB family)